MLWPGGLVYVKWKPLMTGWKKLNCDGAFKGELAISGCGGLLKDDMGAWIRGYFHRLGNCDSLQAEMWGMLLSMKLAWQEGITHVWCVWEDGVG